MNLNIDFTPQEDAWLNAQARQQGLPLAEIIRKLVDAHLHTAPVVTTPAQPAPAVDAENAAIIAQLNAWLKEDATEDPEEIRKSEEEYEELKRNLNANRAATGERLLCP